MSFFSALTVPGRQQHLSFSREDSAILKGYGILFMIFHHKKALSVAVDELYKGKVNILPSEEEE